jgi:hypothetical protein
VRDGGKAAGGPAWVPVPRAILARTEDAACMACVNPPHGSGVRQARSVIGLRTGRGGSRIIAFMAMGGGCA